MMNRFKTIWNNIRQLTGDDAYERYLQHFNEHQLHELEALSCESLSREPLSREAFFKEWQEGKWKGVKRCC